MNRDSIQNTFKVAVGLCLVCSVLVSVFSVGLRDRQQLQKERFRQKNILSAAGLWTQSNEERGDDIQSLYGQYVTASLIDLETNDVTTRMDPAEFDVNKALRDEDLSDAIDPGEDIASIRFREKYSVVYEIRQDGELTTLVLPVRGYGLWSTLWGFIALDVEQLGEGPTSIAVKGLSYYQHGETPGLGGEVDNPLWKEKWLGKLIYDGEWNVLAEVTKTPSSDEDELRYQVDAISGATLTSNGVTYMLQYWLGESGFGPYLQRLVAERAAGQGEPAEGTEEAASSENASGTAAE